MEKRELVRDMVIATRYQLLQDGWAVGKEADIDNPKGRSVSVKIRVHKDLRKTIDWITTVLGHPQDRNIDFLTIHPRTRWTPSSTPINLEALEILTSTFGTQVPILLSGDVFALNSLPFTTPLHTTNAPTFTTSDPSVPDAPSPSPLLKHIPHLSGLMSARALLANPALYAGYDHCPWSAVETFLNKVVKAPLPFPLVLHHVNEMCGPGMGSNKTALLTRGERSEMMNKCGNMVDLIDFLDEKRRGDGGIRRD